MDKIIAFNKLIYLRNSLWSYVLKKIIFLNISEIDVITDSTRTITTNDLEITNLGMVWEAIRVKKSNLYLNLGDDSRVAKL